jgi:DnaJ-class molecular chaperone
MSLDYYQVLGVSRQASPAELRTAFARLAKRHHPDLSQPGADLPQRLREVQQAYRCLSDAGRRALHDDALDARERQHFASQQAVHRRLRRYDRRHPRRPPPPYRRRPWRAMALIASLAAVLSIAWLG